MSRDPVVGRPLPEGTTIFDAEEPGLFDFAELPDNTRPGLTFLFVCPCGCGQLRQVPLDGPHAWQWNGNREKPTIHPSIQVLNGCMWHGFVTDGNFTFV